MIECKFEDGKPAWHGMRHVVVDNIIIKDDKILLIKRAPQLTNGGLWGLVGGYVGVEETMAEASLRELKEEAGYTGKVLKMIEVVDNPHRRGDDLDRQNIAVTHLIEAGEKIQEPDEETTEARWFDLDKMPPENEFAFDHYQIIQTYLKSQNT